MLRKILSGASVLAFLCVLFPTSVLAAESCVPTAIVPNAINHNGLSNYSFDSLNKTYKVHFGAWNTSDQAYVRMDLSPEVNLGSYTDLRFTVQSSSVSGISSSDPLLVQFYDTNWTNGASQEVKVTPVFDGSSRMVTIPLKNFHNSVFNSGKARHLFFRLPKLGKIDADMSIKSLEFVNSACVTEAVPAPAVPATPAISGKTMNINAGTMISPYVDKGILGGNTVDDRVADYFVTTLFDELGGSAAPSGTAMNRPMWRVHTLDRGQPKNQMMLKPEVISGYKCLRNPMIPSNEKEASWASQYPEPGMQNETLCKGDNYYEIEWFDSSPSYGVKNRHAVGITKKSGSSILRYRAMNTDNSAVSSLPIYNTYARYDFKLSSEVPYSVKTKALIMRHQKFDMYLLPDKRVEIKSFGISMYTPVLDMDSWYAFEVFVAGKPGTVSKVSLNGKQVASTTKINSSSATGSMEVQFGILADSDGLGGYGISGSSILNDSFKYTLDEVELRAKSSGTAPVYPFAASDDSKKYISDVFAAHSFDNNNLTWIDYGEIAEELNLELVIQLPHPCETVYGCLGDEWGYNPFFKDMFSVKGHKALIQYMTGKADSDFLQKVEKIKAGGWKLDGGYNWANLRAYHGRVAPFSLRFVEVGNEPYYYNLKYSFFQNEAGFAKWFIDSCEAVKSVNSALKCGIPAQGSSNFNFEKVVATIGALNKGHLIDAFAMHHYVYHPGNRLSDFPFKTMAAAYSYKVHGDGSVYHIMQPYLDTKKYAQKYLASQPAASKRAYWFTEFNSVLSNYKSTPTDQAIDVMYYATMLSYMMQESFSGGAYFFWNGASINEKWRVGVVGEYASVPQVTLNGRLAQVLNKAVSWGGTMVEVIYDGQHVKTEIAESNGAWMAPKVTVVANRAANGGKMTLLVVNRDTAAHTYALNFSSFAPSAKNKVTTFAAKSLTDTHKNSSFASSYISTSNGMSYSFAPRSVTVMEFDKAL